MADWRGDNMRAFSYCIKDGSAVDIHNFDGGWVVDCGMDGALGGT